MKRTSEVLDSQEPPPKRSLAPPTTAAPPAAPLMAATAPPLVTPAAPPLGATVPPVVPAVAVPPNTSAPTAIAPGAPVPVPVPVSGAPPVPVTGAPPVPITGAPPMPYQVPPQIPPHHVPPQVAPPQGPPQPVPAPQPPHPGAMPPVPPQPLGGPPAHVMQHPGMVAASGAAPQLSYRLTHTPQVGNGTQYRQLKVEDALNYLDKVKTQFGNQPQIYNQFLDIMKNFKAQTIDTPGVIRRVSELFKGHNNLILGFNTFLPPGYKIEVVTDGGLGVTTTNPALPAHPAAPGAPRGPAPAAMPPRGPPAAAAAGGARPTGAPPENHAPLEFGHAIQYVTKIKRRFADKPETYKQFLDILHTYQKQQRSIKEVLDRVSVLFCNHPDLLNDFTYFLPDAVQGQAKERLEKRAVGNRTGGRRGRGGSKRIATRAAAERSPRDRAMFRALERQKSPGVGMGPGKTHRAQVAFRNKRRADEELYVQLPPNERQFFMRVKAALGSREAWREFVKTLDMFAQDVISASELMSLVAGVFGLEHASLLDEFKLLIANRSSLDIQKEETWYSLPVSEIDFSQCQQCTPSYRALPADYPMLASSERCAWEAELLNDRWVSVPTGSEDFSFKNMRKNQYEEALFRCEDERYEVDMVIDNNASAIRAIEPLVAEIETLKATQAFEWQFRLDRRALGVIHLKAIARIYGEHGNEMLELLRKNPGAALPIIVKRLKQKDEEWKRSRVELNKVWKEVQEKNYPKSLDHRSFYFKQLDKKQIAPKHLLAQMKALVDQAEAQTGVRTATLSLLYPDPAMHKDVAEVLAHAVEKLVPAHDRNNVANVWTSFLYRFFHFKPEWARARQSSAAFNAGDTVTTAFGTAVVEAVRLPEMRYEVTLSWGRAVLDPSAVTGRVADVADAAPSEAPAAPRLPSPAAQAAGSGMVKPLQNAASAVPAGPVPGATDLPPNVFYTSATGYVFFRLHQMLTHRLCEAKKLCADNDSRVPITVHPADKVAAEARREAGAGAGDGDAPMGASVAEDAAERYQNYLTALFALVDSTMDSSTYEDECRANMGTASYLLFTMEKLVNNAAKNLASLVTDATTSKTRDLFQYQLARRKLVETTTAPEQLQQALHALAMSYQNNVAAMMSLRGEDCYRLEYQTTPTGEAQVIVTFLGAIKYNPHAGSLAPADGVPDYINAMVGGGQPADVQAPSAAAADAATKAAAGKPFLARTAAQTAALPAATAVTSAAVKVAASGKLIHEPGTGDTLVRPGARVGGAAPAPAPAQVHAWQDSRVQEMGGPVTSGLLAGAGAPAAGPPPTAAAPAAPPAPTAPEDIAME